MCPSIYVTRIIPQEALDLLKTAGEVGVWTGELAVPCDTLLEEVGKAEGLLCMLSDRIDAAVIEAAPRLKVISTYAVGYDNIDIARATQRGIPVGNTPGVLTETTADLAFALLMSAARRIVDGDRYVREGRWRVAWGPMMLLGQDVCSSTLGIAGMGRIGAAVARRARGFNMRILYSSRRRCVDIEKELGVEYVLLQELLAKSDYISLHVPLTKETRSLISSKEFSLMKPTAILVNTSRGQVIDQKALYQALKSGKIRAAAIDVAESEPIPAGDPLLSLDNLIITPHIGSASTATRTRMALMAAENLIAGLKGDKLPNCVNPEVYKRI